MTTVACPALRMGVTLSPMTTDPNYVRAATTVSQRYYGTLSWVWWWCWTVVLALPVFPIGIPLMIRSYRRRTAKVITRSLA